MFQVMIRKRLSGEYIFDTPLMESNGNRKECFTCRERTKTLVKLLSASIRCWGRLSVLRCIDRFFNVSSLARSTFRSAGLIFWAEPTDKMPLSKQSKNRCFKVSAFMTGKGKLSLRWA